MTDPYEAAWALEDEIDLEDLVRQASEQSID